jgi:hypothetical protein
MTDKERKRPGWQRIAQLQKMGLGELRVEYERVFGKTTKSRSRKHLYTIIAKKLQETAEQSESHKPQKSALTSKFQPKRKRSKQSSRKGKSQQRKRRSRTLGATDPRLPKVGTIITKIYKGKKVNVKVLDNGFEYAGRQFRSLSAVAREVTGSIWNGYLFFGLTPRPKKKG